MNTRTAVMPVVDADAAIEGLDAIAQTVEAPFRVVSGDRDLEGHRAICVKHVDRCLGPA
jgi:hypothetical protein